MTFKKIIILIIDIFLVLFFTFILNSKLNQIFGTSRVVKNTEIKNDLIVLFLNICMSIIIFLYFFLKGKKLKLQIGIREIKDLFLLLSSLLFLSFCFSFFLHFNPIIRNIKSIEIIIIILSSISEEFLYRAYLISKIGTLASALIFALFHISSLHYKEIYIFIQAFISALILSFFFLKDQNITIVSLSHIAYNLVIILI